MPALDDKTINRRKTVRVFISSTIRDMYAAWDRLRKWVFPKLEESLRERFHHLEPIDLRWGVETKSVDEQHDKALLVLKVCLDEIKRSRPYFKSKFQNYYGG